MSEEGGFRSWRNSQRREDGGCRKTWRAKEGLDMGSGEAEERRSDEELDQSLHYGVKREDLVGVVERDEEKIRGGLG